MRKCFVDAAWGAVAGGATARGVAAGGAAARGAAAGGAAAGGAAEGAAAETVSTWVGITGRYWALWGTCNPERICQGLVPSVIPL